MNVMTSGITTTRIFHQLVQATDKEVEKKTASKRITGRFWGELPVTVGFPHKL